jgi:hypothetical protein
MVIFNYIYRLYAYIINIVCIPFYSKKKDYYLSSPELYYMSQDNNYSCNDGKHEDEDEDEDEDDVKSKEEHGEYDEDNEDEFDEEDSLNIPANKQYLYATSNLHVSKTKRLPKSSSYVSKNYYCGFCYALIETPIFMYSDKVFCTSICRNNQLHQDNQHLNVDNRLKHSHSM